MLRGSAFAFLVVIAAVAMAAPARAEIATWYGYENGPETSSGERFDPVGFCADYPQHSCTCAHRDFPFNTVLRVSWRRKSVVCRVNDRGPAEWAGADVDLSLAGARVLGMVVAGRAQVRIRKLERME